MIMKRIIGIALLGCVAAPALAQETLTVYSNWPREQMEQLAEQFRQNHPEIEVEFYRAAGAELSTQFISEQQLGTGQADYIISDVDFMEIFKKRGFLHPHVPEGISNTNPDAVDEDGVWVAVDFAPYVMVYNTEQVTGEDVPTSWADLASDRWSQRIGMADPRTSAGIQVPLTFWTRVLPETHENFGWPFMEEVLAHEPILTGGHRQLADLVTTGEIHIAAEMPLPFITPQIEAGEPIAIAWPEEGSPTSPNAGAIVEGTDNLEAATAMHEFIASKEGQQFLTDTWGTVPSHLKVDFQTPGGLTLEDLKIRRISIPQEVRDENTERFLEIMN